MRSYDCPLVDSARWRAIEETHTFLFINYIIDTDAVTQQVRIVVKLSRFERIFLRRVWVILDVNIYLRSFLLPVTHVFFRQLVKVFEYFGI